MGVLTHEDDLDPGLSFIPSFCGLFGSQPLVDFSAPFRGRGVLGLALGSLLRRLTSRRGKEMAGEGICGVPSERVALVCEEHISQQRRWGLVGPCGG